MSKTYLYVISGASLILILAAGYLLLSRPNITSSPTIPSSAADVTEQITAENAEETLSQTEIELQTQLDKADEDMTEAQKINTSAGSQEDLSSVNSL